jgi:hypothetical protein
MLVPEFIRSIPFWWNERMKVLDLENRGYGLNYVSVFMKQI